MLFSKNFYIFLLSPKWALYPATKIYAPMVTRLFSESVSLFIFFYALDFIYEDPNAMP